MVLTEREWRDPRRGVVSSRMVARLRRDHNQKPRRESVLERGMLRAQYLANRLGACFQSLRRWTREGRLIAHTLSHRGGLPSE